MNGKVNNVVSVSDKITVNEKPLKTSEGRIKRKKKKKKKAKDYKPCSCKKCKDCKRCWIVDLQCLFQSEYSLFDGLTQSHKKSRKALIMAHQDIKGCIGKCCYKKLCDALCKKGKKGKKWKALQKEIKPILIDLTEFHYECRNFSQDYSKVSPKQMKSNDFWKIQGSKKSRLKEAKEELKQFMKQNNTKGWCFGCLPEERDECKTDLHGNVIEGYEFDLEELCEI